MMKPCKVQIFRWTTSLALAALAVALWSVDHSRALKYLLETLNPEEKKFLVESVFTPQKYFWIRVMATAAVVLPWLAPSPRSIVRDFPLHAIGDVWRAMPAAHRVAGAALLSVWAVRNAVYISFFPITMDEANVYSTFVRRGPAVIVAYYPIPSNHIFHTLSIWLADLWLNGVWAVRLTAFLAVGATGALIFFWTYRHSGLGGAVLAAGTFWFAFAPTLYGVLGRGYAFLGLFALIVLYAEYANRPRLTIIATTLGLWTAPVFLYVVLAAVVIFGRPARMLAALVLAGALYFPVYWAGGNLVEFYRFDEPARRVAHLPRYLPYVAEFLSPLRLTPSWRLISIGAFVVWLIGVAAAAFGRRQTPSRCAARFSLVLLSLMLVPVVQPPDKAFIVWTAPAALAVVGRLGRVGVFAACIVWVASSVAFVPVFRYWYAPDIEAYRKFQSLPPSDVYIAHSEAEYLTFSFYAPEGAKVFFLKPKDGF
ncbi:MAG: hypothetical protein RMM53_02190 [Bacteroidia bacterium]|nr:hypothetical protein [Bacteroidia bacterium]MDW8333005.1 hypothetical protein [Bacteroidia bacterium]